MNKYELWLPTVTGLYCAFPAFPFEFIRMFTVQIKHREEEGESQSETELKEKKS